MNIPRTAGGLTISMVFALSPNVVDMPIQRERGGLMYGYRDTSTENLKLSVAGGSRLPGVTAMMTSATVIQDPRVDQGGAMAKLQARIRRMASLSDGWGGNGSVAVDATAIEVIRTLGSDLLEAVPGVAVVPSVDGSVVLEWETGDVAYTAEIARGDAIDVVEDHFATDGVRELHLHDSGALMAYVRAAAGG